MSNGSDASFQRIAAVCASSIRRTFREHVPLYACSLFFSMATAVLAAVYRLSLPLNSAIFFLSMIAKITCLVAAIAALKHLFEMYRAGRPQNPLSIMGHRLLTSALSGDRFGNMVHGLFAFTPLMIIFAALKVDIVRIHPFSWDKSFMQLGSFMGFGKHYWQILQPILGYPAITTLLSFAYGAWFGVMFGCLFWQLSRTRTDPNRAQYLLAFAFAWFFGGFVIATVFSSAGPCFYSHIVSGPNPYGPLLVYLRETRQHWPIWTVDAQDALWQAYLTGTGDIQGISAMPSMHVTIATLMALLGWRTNRGMGITLTIFAVMIFVGSIMLGWHYSADGLAGAALAVVFWRAAGVIVRTWSRFPHRQSATAFPNAVPAEG